MTAYHTQRAGMWTGRLATRLLPGVIKVSGNTTENESYKYFYAMQ